MTARKEEGTMEIIRKAAGPGAVAAAVLLLGGCISFGGKAPPELISLSSEATAPAGALAGGPRGEALVVLDPEADRRLDVQRVPVRVDDANIAYLKDATWVERPSRQFRRLLAETLRARGGRMILEGDSGDGKARIFLSGRLIDMGYDARSQSVVVRFDAIREETRGLIRSQRFEATVPRVTAKAGPVAAAMNKAANDVARQVADWVG